MVTTVSPPEGGCIQNPTGTLHVVSGAVSLAPKGQTELFVTDHRGADTGGAEVPCPPRG